MGISVVINTKNAAKTLEAALTSVQALATEIIVVDMFSTDETKKIAQNFTTKIYSHQDVGYVEPARNFALSKATQDWILILDADEIIPTELANLLLKLATTSDQQTNAECYYLARKNLIFGQWVAHTGWWPDYVLRFFKRGMAEWSSEIHAVPITKGKVVELSARENLAIEHHNYPSVSAYLERLNRYTSIQAEEKIQLQQTLESLPSTQTQKPLNQEQIGISKGTAVITAWKNELFSRLFLFKGYKDGLVGISLAWLQAMSELIVVLKVWERKRTQTNVHPEDLVTSLRLFQKELNYWLADLKVKNSTGLKKLWWQLRRRLSI